MGILVSKKMVFILKQYPVLLAKDMHLLPPILRLLLAIAVRPGDSDGVFKGLPTCPYG